MSLKLGCIKTIIECFDHPADVYHLRRDFPVRLVKEIFIEGVKLNKWEGEVYFYHNRPICYIDRCEDFPEDTPIQNHFKFNVPHSKRYMKWLVSACLCDITHASGYHFLRYYYRCDREISNLCIRCLKMLNFIHNKTPRSNYLHIRHERFGLGPIIAEQTVKRQYLWCECCKQSPLFELKLGSECMASNTIMHRRFGDCPPTSFLYDADFTFDWSRRISICWYK